MPRRPDVPCAQCGKLIWRSSTSLPPGKATCRACRSQASTTARYEPHTTELRPCKTCGRMFETKQRSHVYCNAECRPHRSGANRSHTRTTPQRGYGYRHQQARLNWKPQVEAGLVECSICGDPITPGAEWDLDHTEDRSGYRGPAHRACNRSDGASRRNGAKQRERTPRGLSISTTASQQTAAVRLSLSEDRPGS